MKPRTTYALYAALALAAGAWLYGYWNSDERRIQRQLGRFASLMEKSDRENALTQANKSRQVGELLTQGFEIHVEPFASVLTDRARLAQVMFQYRSQAERIGVGFDKEELTVDPRLRIADMTAVATVDGVADGRRYRERYRFRMRWLTEDGEWRIQRVELLEILEGNPGLF